MDIGLPENHGAVIITLYYHNIVSLLHKEINGCNVFDRPPTSFVQSSLLSDGFEGIL